MDRCTRRACGRSSRPQQRLALVSARTVGPPSLRLTAVMLTSHVSRFAHFQLTTSVPRQRSQREAPRRGRALPARYVLNCADNLQWFSNLGLRLLTCRPYPYVQALAAGKSEGDDRATTPAGEGSASAAAQRDPPAKEKPRVRPITHTRDPHNMLTFPRVRY